MSDQLYPSDLTDREWKSIKNYIPPARAGGRPRSTEMREVVNAVFYVLRGGISWRMLPVDFPHWKTALSLLQRVANQGALAEDS
jgi:putative transposase